MHINSTDIPLLGEINRIAKKMIILTREIKLQSSKEAAKKSAQ